MLFCIKCRVTVKLVIHHQCAKSLSIEMPIKHKVSARVTACIADHGRCEICNVIHTLSCDRV